MLVHSFKWWELSLISLWTRYHLSESERKQLKHWFLLALTSRIVLVFPHGSNAFCAGPHKTRAALTKDYTEILISINAFFSFFRLFVSPSSSFYQLHQINQTYPSRTNVYVGINTVWILRGDFKLLSMSKEKLWTICHFLFNPISSYFLLFSLY